MEIMRRRNTEAVKTNSNNADPASPLRKATYLDLTISSPNEREPKSPWICNTEPNVQKSLIQRRLVV
jgi:hypothetical protein